MLKVLHVHDVSNVARTLVDGLNENGVQADFYEFKNPRNQHSIKLLNIFITALLRFVEIFRFIHYVNKHTYDIIHIHFGSFVYLPLLARVPYYLHIHGTDVREYINWPILGFVIRKGIENAHKVLFSTPDLKTLIINYRADAIFFPNPVDTEKFQPAIMDSEDDLFDVFSISKIDRYKGVESIFNCIDLLINDKPHVKIGMFGFGNLTKAANELLNNHNKDRNVHIVAKVLHDQMPCLINQSKVILGQMGTGILTCSELEAMACGKPVICNFKYEKFYKASPPIIYAENAYDAKNRIVEMLENFTLAQNIGELAREWVIHHFDKKVVAKKLLSIYQDSAI